MKFAALLLGLAITLSSPETLAQEKVYTITELQELVKSKESEEFFAHAKEIAPTKRDKTWRELVLEATKVLAEQQISSQKCDALWARLEKLKAEFGFLGSQPGFSEVVKNAGVCYLGIDGSYKITGPIDAVGNQVLKAEPSAIVDLTLETRFQDRKDQMIAFLAKNTKDPKSVKTYKNNEKLTEYLLLKSIPKKEAKNFKTVMDNLGLTKKYVAEKKESYQEIMGEFVKGDLTNDPKLATIRPTLETMEAIDDQMAADYAAAMSVTSDAEFKKHLPKFKKLKKPAVAQADKKVSKATPTTPGYWLKGNKDRWKKLLPELKKTLPLIYATAEKECKAFLKSQKETKHVTSEHCDLFETKGKKK